jgi:hypothetical protein
MFDLDATVKVKGKDDIINLFSLNRNLKKYLVDYLTGLGKDTSKIIKGQRQKVVENLQKAYPDEIKKLYQWHIALQDVSPNYLKDSAVDTPQLLEKIADIRGRDKLIVEFLINGKEDKLIDAFKYGKLESFEKDSGKTIQTTMKDWMDKKFETNSGVKELVQDMLDQKYSKKHKRFVIEGVKRDDSGVVKISFAHVTGDRFVRQLPEDGESHWDRPIKNDVISIDPKSRKIVTTYKSSKTFLVDVIESIKKSNAEVELKDDEYSLEETTKPVDLPEIDKSVIDDIKELLKTKVLCAIEYNNLSAEGNPSKVIIEGDNIDQFLGHLDKNHNVKFNDMVDETNITKTYRLTDGRKFIISKKRLSFLSRKFTPEEQTVMKKIFTG